MPAGATQLFAAAPAQAGITTGGYQGLAGYHPTAASVAAAYAAAAANNPLQQAPPLANTPTPVTYAHLTAQLQQHATERYWWYSEQYTLSMISYLISSLQLYLYGQTDGFYCDMYHYPLTIEYAEYMPMVPCVFSKIPTMVYIYEILLFTFFTSICFVIILMKIVLFDNLFVIRIL